VSIIVAVSTGKRVCMVCDSQITNGESVEIHPNKIVRRGPVLFGVSGIIAVLNWIEHLMPEPAALASGLKPWAVQIFVPQLRDWLVERGLMEGQHPGEPIKMPCAVVVARGAEFVCVDRQQAVSRTVEDWIAVGSGEDFAAGALWALQEYMPGDGATADTVVEYRARIAVSAACDLNAYCSRPIDVQWTDE
jgi:ATP-dependent protease HslVU (ClpYQ) peptidase subunit